jgi:hypothetical protein
MYDFFLFLPNDFWFFVFIKSPPLIPPKGGGRERAPLLFPLGGRGKMERMKE